MPMWFIGQGKQLEYYSYVGNQSKSSKIRGLLCWVHSLSELASQVALLDGISAYSPASPPSPPPPLSLPIPDLFSIMEDWLSFLLFKFQVGSIPLCVKNLFFL